MSEVATEEVVDTSVEDFNAGFDEAPTQAAPEPTPEPEVIPEPEPQPEFAQITRNEYEALRAQAAQVDNLKRGIDTSFGKIGGIERVLRELQERTPRGVSVEITDDIVEDMRTEYPDLAGSTLNAFKKFAEKLTGLGSQAPTIDANVINTMVDQRFNPVLEKVDERVSQAVEKRMLARTHKDWQQVVASQEFKGWAGKQPAEFTTELYNSWDADFIGEAISKFKESRKRSEAQIQSRQKRIEAAVTPRSTGGHAPVSNSELDEFNAGFSG